MSKSAHLPFDTTHHVRDHCLCLATQRAARSLARRFDDVLRPFGVTSGQFSLLMALNRPAPPPMGPVASLLAMDRTTLTAALKPLQRRGLVEILVDPNDRRGRLLHLTDAAHDLLIAALPAWRDTHAEIDRDFADGGTALRAGLRALA